MITMEAWQKNRLVQLRKKEEKYDKTPDSFKCKECKSDIMGAQIAHPIHDGPFPMSGSGKCHYDTEPYCPKCEKKPSFHGSSISTGC